MEAFAEIFVPVLAAVAFTALIVLAAELIFRGLRKNFPNITAFYKKMRLRVALTLTLLAVWAGLAFTSVAETKLWRPLNHFFMIVAVSGIAWILIGAVNALFERGLRTLDGDGSYERKKRTQMLVLRRLSTALIVVVTIATVLFSFPQVRTLGISLFASAGILSVIAGLAAQSMFGNLIAGLQLSFSDALRVGDTVVVEGEYGTVGEITLTYVVVNIWDDRRLILPCTYFTSQPFEQWTRRNENIMAAIFMDCSWKVPVGELRTKFDEIVLASEEFDGRYKNCGVVDASNGFVRIRLVMSCASVSDIWPFSRRVHEELISWLQMNHEEALPVTRVEFMKEVE